MLVASASHWYDPRDVFELTGIETMKSSRRVLLPIATLVSCGLLLGCASTPRWYLDGRSQEQLQLDYANCNAVASQGVNQQNVNQSGQYMGQGAAGGGRTVGTAGLAMFMIEVASLDVRLRQCMQAQGYRIVQ